MIKGIFKNAMVGTALAGAVITTAAPEMTGAAISSITSDFNQGYEMEMSGQPREYPQATADGSYGPFAIIKYTCSETGRKYAQFQRGFDNPESFPELASSVFNLSQDKDSLVSNIREQFEKDGLYNDSLISNIKEQFEDDGLYKDNSATPSPPTPFKPF